MISFQTASRGQLSTLLEWASQEGWNPGLNDANAFYSVDTEGFFVALEGETPVAGISVVNHSETFAFLGLYIVRPSHRGTGIGFQLWQHALAHAGNRTIGLDGVAEQQDNYRKSGFRSAGSTTRFVGDLKARPSRSVRGAQAADILGMISAEEFASGSRKERYLSKWFERLADRRTFLSEDGFFTIRRCRIGAKIGPLMAKTKSSAEELFGHAASVFPGPYSIDIPSTSAELVKLCLELDLQPGFCTARMYKGTTTAGTHKLFAVTSLELG